jgi:hypothetical protein
MTIDEGTKKLVNLAERQGYITYHDINDIFPDISGDEMDGLYIKLRTLEIEIIDQPPDRDTSSYN